MTAESAQTPAQLPQDDQAYLQQLGARVRDARTRHGLSRKALAAKSGVSERYLAQLESGQGNISILLLRQVAAALDTPLTELLGERDGHPIELTLLVQYLEKLSPKKLIQAKAILSSAFGEQDPLERRHRIALIGLRGAGKTTLGRRLAAELGFRFVELDAEIERETGMPMGEIFALYGQSGYRRIEQRCLRRALDSGERTVLATGGGIVSQTETYDLLLSRCLTIWLRTSPEEHMQRVSAQGDLRPMAGSAEAMEDLRRILAAREPQYLRADHVVDTSGQGEDESFRALRAAVEDRGR